MAEETLITAAETARHLGDPGWILVDCRFQLGEPDRGRRDHEAGHIPGAVYAHLNQDLSGPIIPSRTGRHPLPDVQAATRTFSKWGITDGVQVVVYDDAGGAIAARLWWMLRWLGHDAVAVLDGGWPAWIEGGFPVSADAAEPAPQRFTARPRHERVVSTDQVLERLGDPTWRLVDSRIPARYRGELEPIDPVAGRIPGAINAPHGENVGPDGRFLPTQTLRARFHSLVGDTPMGHTVFYCGSGVTAARNILTAVHAGLEEPRLYAGSWSEWITDSNRPIETG
ncbi:MAG: sulfurtransferase [Phycisphaerae bacterium]